GVRSPVTVPRADRQLGCIAEAWSMARAAGIDLWLRGGGAMDLFLGEVTRDHGDIDWFAWGRDAAALTEGLLGLGHRSVPGPPPELRLDFAKDGLESSFTLLDTDGEGRVVVAGCPWAGTPWPAGMLDAAPGAQRRPGGAGRRAPGPDRDRARAARQGALRGPPRPPRGLRRP
ncbi:nucleotidyltransferase domain-containing protein, partial [Streptomyces sp. NPDC058964]|uniref:nucleotidyltransferase domain-containing protein n=1 Tax=Streptomyces sp. NPDC058964 TaxID=3346681 RepID=UPI003675D3DF